MTTPSLDDLRREPFHRFEEPFAAGLAARFGGDPDDLAARRLAAAAATAPRLSIGRWASTGAEPGTLGPLVDEALDLVRDASVPGGRSPEVARG